MPFGISMCGGAVPTAAFCWPPTQAVGNMLQRHLVHQQAIKACSEVLDGWGLSWQILRRDELREPISDVDLVITVGGDGTLLEASHHIDSDVPVLGVNSDPTRTDEVEEKLGEFDATRSTGHLCAATSDTLSQILGEILTGGRTPIEVTRLATQVDGALVLPPGLNDVLLAHPCPAAVSRCSVRVHKNPAKCGDSDAPVTPIIHTRCSGLRVCTSTGATAAMRSAGGSPMELHSSQLQYKVREPIIASHSPQQFLHHLVERDEVLRVRWGSRQGKIYLDGAHLHHELKLGSIVEISPSGPPLQIYFS